MNLQTESSGTRPARAPGRFLRNRSGATAVEFAFLVLPFAVLVFAILEICISFAGQQILANAADDVARQLRVGQLKSGDVTEDSLKATICGRLAIVLAGDCDGLEVDLREFATFEEAATVRIAFTGDAGGRDLDTTDFDVTPGPSGSKNMLRVFYKWPVVTDFMAKMMSNLKDGKTLHFASVTWQNELFED
jgi:Flp pilus assembly protein TadG